jgi:flagellar basal body-associated protein FliL
MFGENVRERAKEIGLLILVLISVLLVLFLLAYFVDPWLFNW